MNKLRVKIFHTHKKIDCTNDWLNNNLQNNKEINK